MRDGETYDKEKCEENRKGIYERMHEMHSTLHKEIGNVQTEMGDLKTDVSGIKGGVRVVVYMLPILAALVGMVFHAKLEVISTKIDGKQEVHGGIDNDDQNHDPEKGQAASGGSSDSEVHMDDLETFEDDGGLGPLLRGESPTLEHRTRKGGSPGPSGSGLGLRNLEVQPK